MVCVNSMAHGEKQLDPGYILKEELVRISGFSECVIEKQKMNQE